ncbi:uncharacterized protein LOC133470978 [Phyllopteryx taeniolatus]|uniref:uncharacterized protein LOC133470978 n=1 Tax=Phyllopteryx taeniolatus TaxID=161469 RepID=UPI002AD50FDB|nr:uncharacterized protein LOC133470978 [Phyllopteryx taeniolatus]
MTKTCSVWGCTARYAKNGLGFFRFPSKKSKLIQRNLWVTRIRRVDVVTDWEPNVHHRVCGRHFLAGCPNPDPGHPDFAPSLHLQPEPAGSSPSASAKKRATDKRARYRPDGKRRDCAAHKREAVGGERAGNRSAARRRCNCSVPRCSRNSQPFPYLSFRSFPEAPETRGNRKEASGRDRGPAFQMARGPTLAFCRRFAPGDVYASAADRVRIRPGAVPSRVPWNSFGRSSPIGEAFDVRLNTADVPLARPEEAGLASTVEQDHAYAYAPTAALPRKQKATAQKEAASQPLHVGEEEEEPEPVGVKEGEEDCGVSREDIIEVQVKSEDEADWSHQVVLMRPY